MSTIEMAGALSVGKTLQHYGRLGMKWGVRRSRQQLESDPVGTNSAADPDAIKAVKTQAKIKEAGSLNVVSSKDLQELVKRMELEKKYIAATLEAKPQTKKGDSFVKKLIKSEAETYLLKGKPGPVVSMLKEAFSTAVAPPPKPKDTTVKAKVVKPQKEKKPKAKAPRNPQVYNITSIGRG